MLYTCPSCGASMVYDPEAKALVCPSCGSHADQMPGSRQSDGTSCPNCGAQLEGIEKKLVCQCPYCMSWMSLDQNLAALNAPKRITPFSFGRQSARARILKAFDNIPFLPDSFLAEPDGKDIEAVYVPFWLYDVNAYGVYDYSGEKTRSFSSGNKTITDHDVYDIHREASAEFSRVPIDAMDEIDDQTIDAAVPFNREEEQPMDPIYLAGASAFLPDKDKLEQEYQDRARKWTFETLDLKENGRVAGYSSLKSKGKHQTAEMTPSEAGGVLLPVYRYLFKGFGNHKIYMNGTTGRMSGDAPCDKKKVIINYLIEAACVVISAASAVGILGVLL